MQQKTQTQVTQVVFNVNTLQWQIYFHIRGCNTIINITSREAESFLNSVSQGDNDRINIEHCYEKSLIYYIIN